MLSPNLLDAARQPPVLSVGKNRNVLPMGGEICEIPADVQENSLSEGSMKGHEIVFGHPDRFLGAIDTNR